VLRIIDRELRPGMRTLETGEGLSTVVFALHGADHTCVTPNTKATDRIRSFCAEHDIALDSVRFEQRYSEQALPHLDLGALDIVLVDGGHGFPTPFIDWYYAGGALRPGGMLIVDDTQLWTGDILKQFLDSETGWQIETELPARTAIFRRVGDGPLSQEWTEQPFVWDRSRQPGQAGNWGARAGRALAAARAGRWDVLRERVARRLGR
jgi:hypothetical protein